MKVDREIQRINNNLKFSFQAIGQDIRALKDHQITSSTTVEDVREQLQALHNEFLRKAEFDAHSKFTVKQADLEKTEAALQLKIKEVQKKAKDLDAYNKELTKTVNARVGDINKQLASITKLKDQLETKIAEVDDAKRSIAIVEETLKAEFAELNKKAVTDSQVRKLVKDINAQFIELKREMVTRDQLKAAAKKK